MRGRLKRWWSARSVIEQSGIFLFICLFLPMPVEIIRAVIKHFEAPYVRAALQVELQADDSVWASRIEKPSQRGPTRTITQALVPLTKIK